MNTLKIGIMPKAQFNKRVIDIAAGRYKPGKDEPKIWFSSLKSVAEVLNEKNIELLEIINQSHPESLLALSKLTGRHTSNLSRTLKTLEKYQIVSLVKKNRGVTPVVKANKFKIDYNPTLGLSA